MTILVLNAGSSTLKCALFDASARSELASGLVDWKGASGAATCSFRTPEIDEKQVVPQVVDYFDAVTWIMQRLDLLVLHDPITTVGHRVVHGGTDFVRPTMIDQRVIDALQRISNLAPLHNPPALKVIDGALAKLPDATHVAVFDTAFFANLPLRAVTFPVPYSWREQYGIRRYGFHGISHAYCASRAAELLERPGDESLKLVICHLGNGCSATATRGGQPIATTMGFTPLDGLMMGSRSGAVDPGILLYLMQHQGLSANQLDDALNRHSGLLGVSGVSSDFREVQQAALSGNRRADLAISMFADRIRATIGAFAVTLGGIDGLVFTAGIGAHSAFLRRQVCDGLQCLNLVLDEEKNQEHALDVDIASIHSAGRILLIQTREEQAIAGASQELITSNSCR